jgi:hypothetical protein
MKAIAHWNNPREAWRPGVETRTLVSASNGATQLCIFEQWVAPGTGAPTHSHPVEEVLTIEIRQVQQTPDFRAGIQEVAAGFPRISSSFRTLTTALALQLLLALNTFGDAALIDETVQNDTQRHPKCGNCYRKP